MLLIVLFCNNPSMILLVFKARPCRIKFDNIFVSIMPSEIWAAELLVRFYPEISTDFLSIIIYLISADWKSVSYIKF
mgnify:CR=1 FL=1